MTPATLTIYAVVAALVIVCWAVWRSSEDALDDVAHDFRRNKDRAWPLVTAGVGLAMLLLGLWGGTVFCNCGGV